MATIEGVDGQMSRALPDRTWDDIYMRKASSMAATIKEAPPPYNIIEWDELKNMTYMTQGAMCDIFTADYRGMKVVVKVPRTDCEELDVAVRDLEVELEVLNICNHKHIIKLIGAGYRPSEPHRFIALELLELGTLRDTLNAGENDARAGASGPKNVKKTKKYQTFHVLRMVEKALELASAIQYLHDEVSPSIFIIHRDVKADNIGFKKDGKLKLFDFGLARIAPRRNIMNDRYDMTGETGSMRYMAPEVVESLPYNEKVDVYAFGLLLWEMLQTTQVFLGMSVREFYTRVINGGARPPLEDNWTPELQRLISNCWHHDADRRPPFRDIVRHLHTIYNKEKHIKIAMSSMGLVPQCRGVRGKTAASPRSTEISRYSSNVHILRSMTFPDDVLDMVDESNPLSGSDEISVRRSSSKKAGFFRRLIYLFSRNKTKDMQERGFS